MKSLLKLLSVLVFALVLMVQPVSAAEQQSGGVSLGLAVSPPTFELSANPGDKLERSIRVDNLVDKPIPITVDRRNFAALGEEGQAVLTEEVTPFSLASWIKVDPTTVTIPAKASHVFKFTVQDAAPFTFAKWRIRSWPRNRLLATPEDSWQCTRASADREFSGYARFLGVGSDRI
jgi:hypothetical protein